MRITHQRISSSAWPAPDVEPAPRNGTGGRVGDRRASDTDCPQAPAATPRRVAVLPFVNVTARPVIDGFSCAITQRMLDALSSLGGVLVVLPSAPLAADGGEVHSAMLGRLLQVDALLLGNVREVGGAVGVIAELRDATSGACLWVGCTERPRRPAVDLEGQAVADIVCSLAGLLGLRPVGA